MNIDIEQHEYVCFIPDPWKQSNQSPISWFKSNFHSYIYSKKHILENGVPYELSDGPNAGGVYFLTTKEEICYIGISNAIYRRLMQHYKNTDIYFTHYWCFGGMPELFVEYIEGYYIHKFKPIFNNKYPILDEVVEPYLK